MGSAVDRPGRPRARVLGGEMPVSTLAAVERISVLARSSAFSHMYPITGLFYKKKLGRSLEITFKVSNLEDFQSDDEGRHGEREDNMWAFKSVLFSQGSQATGPALASLQIFPLDCLSSATSDMKIEWHQPHACKKITSQENQSKAQCQAQDTR